MKNWRGRAAAVLIGLMVLNLLVIDLALGGSTLGVREHEFAQAVRSEKDALLVTVGIVSYRGPGDAVPGATAYYGLRAYDADYAAAGGKAVQLRRASDGAVRDVNVLRDGSLDRAAAQSFCQSTQCYVAIWYDQTGHGNDAAQEYPDQQPQLLFNAQTGQPAVQFDSRRMTYLQAAFPWVSGNDPWAGQVALLNVQPTDWYEPIFDYGSMDANLGLFALVHESGAYQFSASIYDSDRLSGFASMAPAAVTFYSSGSQVGGYINGANWAQPFDQSDITGTAFAIGGSPLQHGIWLSGGLGEVVLYSAALSAAEAHALAVNESEYFGFALAKPEPEQATCARNCNPA